MSRKRSSGTLKKAKKLLDSLQEKALKDPDIEFKEVRGLAEAWIKLYQLEEKYKSDDEDDGGIDELKRKLHGEPGVNNGG